jgi:hypothetical protein
MRYTGTFPFGGTYHVHLRGRRVKTEVAGISKTLLPVVYINADVSNIKGFIVAMEWNNWLLYNVVEIQDILNCC